MSRESKISFLYLLNRNDNSNIVKCFEISWEYSDNFYFETLYANDKQLCIRDEYTKETAKFRVHSCDTSSANNDEIVNVNYRGSNIPKIYLRSTNQDLFLTVYDVNDVDENNYFRYYAY